METVPGARVDGLLRQACARIEAVDAQWLLAHVLARTPAWLYAHADAAVDADAAVRYDALVARRAAGEPVAYLTGTRGFWSFELAVTSDTLIPRAETELLVELALARLPRDRDLRVADLGTGSGAIAIALARERPRACVLGTDASDAALAVARGNARHLAVANLHFERGDWCAALGEARFDLVASNPPYIEAADPHLRQGDLRHEPIAALASGGDGLDAIRRIVADAPLHLVPSGWLLLEHGWTQGTAVRALLQEAGFEAVDTHRDLESRDRVSAGRWPDVPSSAVVP
ncbi:peptide chain release factor N(5)-glutamine methyltransferase [Cognatiluteimonas telluris]|uniref:peptide chain release factor N(5)-glutamine methyltransferase n=1 Tax=Cognatiluteimonas telluris TaxID=1104775 RepID=UPI00140C5BF4|nr:peptide chain release factor N(5)-glutamine methyltransferase [Lysobacter telluris]